MIGLLHGASEVEAGFHMPHLKNAGLWKFMASALMASTIVSGACHTLAQGSKEGEPDNPLQASQQLTRVDIKQLTHEDWLGMHLMKIADDSHVRNEVTRVNAAEFKGTPEVMAFLTSMKIKTKSDQITAVDKFVNRTVTFKPVRSGGWVGLDHWQTVQETFDKKTGDSIDYVTAKSMLLMKLGFKTTDVAVVLGSSANGEHHSLLYVKNSDHPEDQPKWEILGEPASDFKESEGLGEFQPKLMIDHTGIYKVIQTDIIWGEEFEKNEISPTVRSQLEIAHNYEEYAKGSAARGLPQLAHEQQKAAIIARQNALELQQRLEEHAGGHEEWMKKQQQQLQHQLQHQEMSPEEAERIHKQIEESGKQLLLKKQQEEGPPKTKTWEQTEEELGLRPNVHYNQEHQPQPYPYSPQEMLRKAQSEAHQEWLEHLQNQKKDTNSFDKDGLLKDGHR
jgi:predicted transglutaminase-like cysteine proteinase